MNANTEVDLAKLHEAIAADIQAQFPQLVTVEFYREDRKSLPTPACLLELTEMEALQDEDPGTEQLAVMAKFEAELIIGFRETKAKQAISILAASLAAWLRKRRWVNPDDTTKKLPTGAAEVIGAYRDDFAVMNARRDTDLPQFEVWRVEWQQIVHVGVSVWNDEGVVPSQVFLQGHVNGNPGDGYEEVTD